MSVPQIFKTVICKYHMGTLVTLSVAIEVEIDTLTS